jgi:hypothetical protein
VLYPLNRFGWAVVIAAAATGAFLLVDVRSVAIERDGVEVAFLHTPAAFRAATRYGVSYPHVSLHSDL